METANRLCVPRSPRVTDSIVEEVRAVMRKLEQQFQVRCAVVFNPYRRVTFGEGVLSLSLMVCPQSQEDDPQFEERAHACCDTYQHHALSSRRSWHCHCMIGGNWFGWFRRFRVDPGRFPLADMGNGADLISDVLYGLEAMEEIRTQARAFFGDHILPFWQREAQRRRVEMDAKIAREEQEYRLYCEERGKLLNRYELEELQHLLTAIVQIRKDKPFEAIVALDGSGRPLGKALEWYAPEPIRVFYIDPHPLKKLARTDAPAWKDAGNVLEHELPDLSLLWKAKPEVLLFVDDQTGYGHTYHALQAFTKELSGRDELRLATLSQYQGDNTPSWLRKRDIQGIELVEDRFTFLARECPTRSSEQFYSELKTIVLSWKENPT